jgi:steroid delta-isomerase-like uncharacterized protein
MKAVSVKLLTAGIFFLMFIACKNKMEETKNINKKNASLWYEAFDKHDPTILDKILSETWYESPSETQDKVGREDAKRLLLWLTTVFPDFRIRIDDIIEEGDKVVVRSEISGTQAKEFIGYPAKYRKLKIQAIDIHQFKDGKIIHTWHSEDWMTGLKQLGVLEKN